MGNSFRMENNVASGYMVLRTFVNTGLDTVPLRIRQLPLGKCFPSSHAMFAEQGNGEYF